jgi:hypothetical protein
MAELDLERIRRRRTGGMKPSDELVDALIAEVELLRRLVAAGLAVCDEGDRWDQGVGHWVSTAFVRAALTHDVKESSHA